MPRTCRNCASYNACATIQRQAIRLDDAVGLRSIIRLRKGQLQAETYHNFNLLTDLLR